MLSAQEAKQKLEEFLIKFKQDHKAISGIFFVEIIIGLVIAVVVATALIPTIVTQVNTLTSGADPPLTGAAATLVGQIPLFIALALMLVAVAVAIGVMRKTGAIGAKYIDIYALARFYYIQLLHIFKPIIIFHR